MAKYKYIGKLKGEDGEVEAFKWTGDMTQIEDPEWIVEEIKKGRVVVSIDNDNKVTTMMIWFGVWVRANIGDYIVKYEKGQIVPYQSIYFEKRYKQCKEEIDVRKYMGIKIVKAEPLSREEFYKFGNSEGYEEAKTPGYKVEYEDGYISWCPKEVFEKSYSEIKEGLPYGVALEKVKKGKGMRLPDWNPDVVIRAQYPDEHSKMTVPYLYVESRFGRVPWKETMIEIFAENWEVID